ncbi:MAG: S49 family peptidase [Marinilabiliales bacterium]|nr:S49 family peptidase [Marinilabiliales bacterium]
MRYNEVAPGRDRDQRDDDDEQDPQDRLPHQPAGGQLQVDEAEVPPGLPAEEAPRRRLRRRSATCKTTIEKAVQACGSADVIVAMGGDGTVADTLQGIFDAGKQDEVLFGVIPFGSGNAFRKTFAIPKNPLRAIDRLAEGVARPIDLMEVEGRIAAFASIGATAQVTDEKLSGKIQGLWGHLRGRPPPVRHAGGGKTIELFDGRDASGPFAAKTVTSHFFDCIVNKTNHFGYSWYIAPEAVVDDGYLDITLFEMKPLKYAVLFPLIYFGLLPAPPAPLTRPSGSSSPAGPCPSSSTARSWATGTASSSGSCRGPSGWSSRPPGAAREASRRNPPDGEPHEKSRPAGAHPGRRAGGLLPPDQSRPARRGQAPGGRPGAGRGQGQGPDDRHRRDDLGRARNELPLPREERRRPRLRAPRAGRGRPVGQGGHPQARHPGRRGDGERHRLSRDPALQGSGPGRPVIGLMMSVAASGGYYIASACDVIIAHPSTLTGFDRRHLHLPQRRIADVQGRGQGRRHQVRPGQGFGLSVPGHDRGREEALPGDHRRVLRGLPGRRGQGPQGQDPGRPSSGRSRTAASTRPPRP